MTNRRLLARAVFFAIISLSTSAVLMLIFGNLPGRQSLVAVVLLLIHAFSTKYFGALRERLLHQHSTFNITHRVLDLHSVDPLTVEEAEVELRAQGVDVDGFRARLREKISRAQARQKDVQRGSSEVDDHGKRR